MEEAILFLLLLSFLHLHFQKVYTAELEIISSSTFLTDQDTLVSSNGSFELGFFKPDGSENRYLGIWYKKLSVRTVVWVANRDHPLTNGSSNALKIADRGTLVLVNSISDVVWSSNTTSSGNVTAQLYDNGNLVVTRGSRNGILWQSFDYPTDTLLPEMKFGRDFVTGREWHLSSWTSNQDPARGKYTYSVDLNGYPQHVLKEDNKIKYRAGPWNGMRFSGASEFGPNKIFTYAMLINKSGEIYSYNNLEHNPVTTRLTLTTSRTIARSVWVQASNKWQDILSLPKDYCDNYMTCGGNAICSIDRTQACACLDDARFKPRNEKGWDAADWSDGCVRRTPLDCKTGSDTGSDGFVKYYKVKLPDTQGSWFSMSMNLKECEAMCLKNCTCMAYANTDIRGEGSGCLLWFNDLVDMRVITEGNGGQDIHVRMAASDLEKKKGGANIKVILPVIFTGILLVCLGSTWFWCRWRKTKTAKPTGEDPLLRRLGETVHVPQSQEEAMELPLFSFLTIVNATANFSPENKLGEGGFGPVYKGILEEGREIAVKRLSRTSNQGLDEFKNEVICISKLQHRNLVKLLGCCIQGEEKLLIYEYMPNRSLDSFIFDKMRSTLIDWTTRFDIIKGIARGLLYLHQDSRLRIIHRDLKASNILLDQDMTPKISDFGIARSFGGNETEANTQRVVGTYGYMSPEYAIDGIFSTKSDVFSYGVLVLEIVSGKRNRAFLHTEHANNLIGHAWRIHNEGRYMDLIDSTLTQSYHDHPSEVLRSVTVALLCVQESPDDRPSMSSVIQMLGSEGELRQPKQPAFFMEKELFQVEFSSSTYPASSTNDLTITEIDPR